MPFDARVIQPEPDEPAGALPAAWLDHDSLPDELAELAGQLSADAEQLARRFPARQPPSIARTSPARWGWAVAGAALAASLVAGWFVMQTGPQQHSGTANHLAARDEASAPRTEIAHPVADSAGPPRRVRPAPVRFEQLSAPQQEAVLDLMETTRQPPDSLSI